MREPTGRGHSDDDCDHTPARPGGRGGRGGAAGAFSWLFMLVSMGGVTWLTIWSFSRILRGKAHFDPDGTGPAHAPVQGRHDQP